MNNSEDSSGRSNAEIFLSGTSAAEVKQKLESSGHAKSDLVEEERLSFRESPLLRAITGSPQETYETFLENREISDGE